MLLDFGFIFVVSLACNKINSVVSWYVRAEETPLFVLAPLIYQAISVGDHYSVRLQSCQIRAGLINSVPGLKYQRWPSDMKPLSQTVLLIPLLYILYKAYHFNSLRLLFTVYWSLRCIIMPHNTPLFISRAHEFVSIVTIHHHTILTFQSYTWKDYYALKFILYESRQGFQLHKSPCD